jgi:hypothetical protein
MLGMREAAGRMIERLPLQFRVLYRQFLLRVVDLEALSMQADVAQLLGQFAGVLILISVLQTIGFLFLAGIAHGSDGALINFALQKVMSFIAGTMLIVGLVTVVSWDAIFPDRRDAMVLGPLPVKPGTILAAKLAASGALLGIAVAALNFGMGTVLPMVMGGSFPGVLRGLFAWWFTMAAATVFLFGAVLAAQGWAALLLPRRAFLRLSAVLQLAAFALFLTQWIFQPSFAGLATMDRVAGRWPASWFLCLMLQVDGRLPPELAWMARRAWIGAGISAAAAAASLLLCYLRTMKKTVEEPDLLPGAGGRRFPMRWGDALSTAIVQFSIRSLGRSKQHRVIYAFFLAITFAIAVSTVRDLVAGGAVRPLTQAFLMPTLVMMCLAVVGLRSVHSLPVSLKANWVLQVTQLRPSQEYLAATRRAMLVMAAGPVWLVAAALSLSYRPWSGVAEHLAVLALLASIMTDLSLINVSKIPFACSYLPGKSNVQYMFWAFAVGFMPIAMEIANWEHWAFANGRRTAAMLGIFGALAVGFWAVNRHRARSAVLYYEETEPEVITTLGLSGMVMEDRLPAQAGSAYNAEICSGG